MSMTLEGFFNLVIYLQVTLGNWNIKVFYLLHPFSVMRQKFLKFRIGQNAAEKFWIVNNESVKLQNSMKVDEIIV
jgi:hypothetical protein